MTPPTDILFVVTKATWGGAQRYVCDLASSYAKDGRRVLVAYGTPGLLVKKLEAAGVGTVAITGLARDIRLGSDWRAYRELRALFLKTQPRVVHLNSSKAGGLGALAARRAGVRRIVFTAHGWAWNEDRGIFARFLIRLAAYGTVLLAHRTICVSEAMRRDARWMPFLGGKFVTIKNGIDAPAFLSRADARRALLPEKDGRWIGMISELHPTKRVTDALRAFALLAASRGDAFLVILGDGECRDALLAEAKERKIAEKTLFMGFVPDAAIYLPAFDAFLHASRSESFGYAVAEAGLAALPVVATRVGAIPEIVEDGESGTLVASGDAAGMARALAAYLDNEALGKSHGEALAMRVRRDFAVARMARETLAAYEPTNS